MKNLSNGEKIFLIYSIINLIVMWHGTRNIGILNEDIAFGLAISYFIFLYSYIIYNFLQPIIECK